MKVEICPVTAADCDKLPCGQKCLYKLTGSTEPTEITATHTTPVSKWGMRDIMMILTCAVQVCGQPHLHPGWQWQWLRCPRRVQSWHRVSDNTFFLLNIIVIKNYCLGLPGLTLAQITAISGTWLTEPGEELARLYSLKWLREIHDIHLRLSESDGFSEATSDSVCTQQSTADCTRYWVSLEPRWMMWRNKSEYPQ